MHPRRRQLFWLKLSRVLILLAGLLAGQFIVYGPSLVGQKVLLPLDVLGMPGAYNPELAAVIQDPVTADLVEQWEPARQFTRTEFLAGRVPLWNPHQFAGSPVVWPKFSPFFLLQCSVASPLILAWTQLFAALLAGTGFFLFVRRATAVSFWPAAITAWCYPLTGYFILWQGFPTAHPVYWLPWLLLAVDYVVRRGCRFSPAGLGVVTGLILVCGALDVGGQVLLVSGLYALWCWFDEYGWDWWRWPAQKAGALLTAGYLSGFLLAAPYVLPLLEYAHTGARIERRGAGAEERPPEGWQALPRAFFPDVYGSARAGSHPLVDETQHESAAADYAGLIAALLLAPLAWCDRRKRWSVVYWCLLAIFGLSWCLNLPGFVTLLRLPLLNLMSHDRLVFATALAILVLAAIGLETLRRQQVRRQTWFFLFIVLLLPVTAWWVYRMSVLPPAIAALKPGDAQLAYAGDPDVIRANFVTVYSISGALSAAALIGWLLVTFRPEHQRRLGQVLGVLMVTDLLWFGCGHNVQCDPALYYPRIPALAAVAAAPPGRVVGHYCLPASLAQVAGLDDIRGYDAIDPKNLMDLMEIAASPDSLRLPYAETQWFNAREEILPPDGVELSPVLDLLGVRYVIHRGTPPADVQPAFQSDDYWVLVNHRALPRVFVPQRVQTVTDPAARLKLLADTGFDPRTVAYVETTVDLPEPAAGHVEITGENSTRVTISAQMETRGLIVLADLWDQGWKARLDGKPALISRVDHALRGVVVPAGRSTLEFRYEPASFQLGLKLAGLGAVLLVLWLAIAAWILQRSRPVSNGQPGA